MTDPIKPPMIRTHHFGGREMPLITVLLALAAQEGNDGDEGNAMQMAADVLTKLMAENERLLVMADEPTTKRVWDGIQAMAALFADPDHMPTVLEFKAAFDAAFVIDGKPYDVERIKAEWQADYAAMEARAAQAEAERDRWIADWRGEKAEAERLDEHAGALECSLERVRSELAASLERERSMREALKKCAAAFEQPLTGVEEAALKAARATLQPKEPANG